MKSQPRMLRRLERRPLLSQSVQEEIKAYVIDNGLRPGDPLPSESAFAQQLGVSRNSVREAAKSLQTLGYVEARVGSGLFVGRFSIDTMLDQLPFDIAVDATDFSEAFSAREYLELGMADDIMARADAGLDEALDAILTEWRKRLEAGQYEAELDLAFHRTLAAGIENHVAIRLVELLWAVRDRARESGVISPPRDITTTFERHVAIAGALRDRDLDAYRAAVAEHYAGSRREAAEPSEMHTTRDDIAAAAAP